MSSVTPNTPALFKAWVAHSQRMWAVDFIDCINQIVGLRDNVGRFSKMHLDSVELLKNTGLIDRRKRAVYESDVIVLANGLKWIVLGRANNQLAFAWYDNSAIIASVSELDLDSGFEIVGNLYED